MNKTISDGSSLMRLHSEVNRLRARDGKEELGLIGLAYKIQRFHPDKHPLVAEALKNTGLTLKNE